MRQATRARPAARARRAAPVARAAPARQTALVPVSVRASAPLVLGDCSAVVVSAGRVQIAIRDSGVTSPDWVARLVGQLAAAGAS